MILLVVGRRYDPDAAERCLRELHRDYDIELLIEGGENFGVDEYAREFARAYGIPNMSYHAKSERTGKRSSWLLRNLRMMHGGKPNMVVTFDREDKVAQHCVAIAHEQHIPVRYA